MLSTLLFQKLSAEPIKLQTATTASECLTRDQKEKIEICFEENAACHESLSKVKLNTDPEKSSLRTILISVLGGIVLGLALDSQLRK